MIDNIKPIGAFVENTIRPLLGELKWFLDEAKAQKLEINENNIRAIADYLFRCSLRLAIIQLIQNIAIASILGVVIWKISPSFYRL